MTPLPEKGGSMHEGTGKKGPKQRYDNVPLGMRSNDPASDASARRIQSMDIGVRRTVREHSWNRGVDSGDPALTGYEWLACGAGGVGLAGIVTLILIKMGWIEPMAVGVSALRWWLLA